MGAPSSGYPPPPLPGWLGSAVQVTTQVGVPTVFAAVLLYFVLFRVTATLEVIQKNEDRRTEMLATVQKAFAESITQQTAAFEAAIRENIAVNRELAERYHGPKGPK